MKKGHRLFSRFARIGSLWAALLLPAQTFAADCSTFRVTTDGCTGMSALDAWLGENVFKSSCNKHDKCYGVIGNTKSYCDSVVYSNWKDDCDDEWNKYLFPSENRWCRDHAQIAYGALKTSIISAQSFSEAQGNAKIAAHRLRDNSFNGDCVVSANVGNTHSAASSTFVESEFKRLKGRSPQIFEMWDALLTMGKAVDSTSYANWKYALPNWIVSQTDQPPVALPTATVSLVSNSVANVTWRFGSSNDPDGNTGGGLQNVWIFDPDLSTYERVGTMDVTKSYTRSNGSYSKSSHFLLVSGGQRDVKKITVNIPANPDLEPPSPCDFVVSDGSEEVVTSLARQCP